MGTEERSAGYTLYVIQVTIGRVVSKIFLRYSEIKLLADSLAKDFPELPGFQPPSWLKNKESKIIEQRKTEIEDFILALLVNDEFYNKDK